MTADNLKSLSETINARTRGSEREELRQLVHFAFTCPVIPPGECIISEAPDLIVQTSDGLLGIEHTRILRPLVRAQEQLQNKIVDKAKELHDQQGGAMLWLYIDFNMHAVLERKRVTELATKLCNAVSFLTNRRGTEVAGDQWQDVELWDFSRRYPNIFPLEISKISFKYVPNQPGFVLWGTPRSTMVPRLTTEQMQLTMDAKEVKWSNYKSKCSALWLLIATSSGEPSSYYILPEDVAAHVYESSFSRVFYHDSFSPNGPIELNTRP